MAKVNQTFLHDIGKACKLTENYITWATLCYLYKCLICFYLSKITWFDLLHNHITIILGLDLIAI